jgi:hypothetical protein
MEEMCPPQYHQVEAINSGLNPGDKVVVDGWQKV